MYIKINKIIITTIKTTTTTIKAVSKDFEHYVHI